MIRLLKIIWARYRQLAIYCIIGCSGAGLDFVAYTVLTTSVGLHYQLSNFVSVGFGIINNFFWNYFFNFKVKDKMFGRLVSFYCVGMFGWALSAFLLWLFIDKVGINSIAAKLGTIIFVTVLQFSLNKFITFKKTKESVK